MRGYYEKSAMVMHYEQIDTEEEIMKISPSVLGQQPNRTKQEHAQVEVPVNTRDVGGHGPNSFQQEHACVPETTGLDGENHNQETVTVDASAGGSCWDNGQPWGWPCLHTSLKSKSSRYHPICGGPRAKKNQTGSRSSRRSCLHPCCGRSRSKQLQAGSRSSRRSCHHPRCGRS